MNENNLINISGTIINAPEFSHHTHQEDFYLFYISCERDSGINDVIPVIISNRLINLDKIIIGETIDVIGQIRSRNVKENENDSHSKLVLSVFARDIMLGICEHNNHVRLEGYICKPPVYRKTPSGREIADLLIAVNRQYGKSDYIPCIAWGRNARFASMLEVGERIELTGRFQSRAYYKKMEDGTCEDRIAYEVSINAIYEEENNEE